MERGERIYQLWVLVVYFAMVFGGLLLILSALGLKAMLGISLIYLAEKL